MKILIINGPNINMLGVREPEKYGVVTYKELVKKLSHYCRERGVRPTFFQSNYEGDIVGRIQKARNVYDGIVLNAAAYTHTSVAILDALRCACLPCVEVHITDISSREDYRKKSFVSEYAFTVIKGEGTNGYEKAVDALISRLNG